MNQSNNQEGGGGASATTVQEEELADLRKKMKDAERERVILKRATRRASSFYASR